MIQSSATVGPISESVPHPSPAVQADLVCPAAKPLRARLRAMASDLVSSWHSSGIPASAKTAAGLRSQAEVLVARAGGRSEHVGWTMVTIVSEHWRERLRTGSSGRRLLLLPDCPVAVEGRHDSGAAMPHVCGPRCAIGTIWTAARDSGWVVESTSQAVAAIGSLLTGQYDGILGVAKLEHLEKAFAMLPAFSLPIAAVPFEPSETAVPAGTSCADAVASSALDVEWVLGLIGVAGGDAAPVGDYLPLLREAAGMFAHDSLAALAADIGMPGALGEEPAVAADDAVEPLDATGRLAGDFLARGGKFLRPFITLASFDAVSADRHESGAAFASAEGSLAETTPEREAVKAAAVAIEIFHKASLVHDDIEDGDRMRYGRPTMHVERGIPTALNAGDYLLGLGYRIIASLPGVQAAAQRDLVAILADAHVRLAKGQGAELWWRDAANKRLTPAESLAIYGLKTSPAFEAAVAIGIRLAGVRPADAGAIDRYALHVGNGFQVLNDLKDWCGDLENDRRAAGDLLGGRPTLMWALALERLPAEGVARLMAIARQAGRPDASEQEVADAIAETRRLYERAEVFARAAAIVDDQRNRAAAAAATCRLGRLREVLEFLLDLAVPEQAAARFVSQS